MLVMAAVVVRAELKRPTTVDAVARTTSAIMVKIYASGSERKAMRRSRFYYYNDVFDFHVKMCQCLGAKCVNRYDL